ncbi:FAD linked oxidase, C-terminal domain protein [Mycobacterium kansasii]|uniref:FAD linked oxidase, C-terminal domain protein n=1 Tax=Mycobacterium kansasii TaxID=1768 RepID=A0A1V3WDW5_MYCKA|nr:FAD linked oxidase, C-terminal domain protein [Mycobacterium kansasii]
MWSVRTTSSPTPTCSPRAAWTTPAAIGDGPVRWCGQAPPSRSPRCCGCAGTPGPMSPCKAVAPPWWPAPFRNTTTCCCPPKDFVRWAMSTSSNAVSWRAPGHAGGGAARRDGGGLVFGVDLSARDSATVGGMAATNAGGLRTVRYGNMSEQLVGLDVALPDGSVLHRHSRVRRDNTGYDLPALFVGAEGTLGVITQLDLRLHPAPSHRVTAICGFSDLDALVAAGRVLRDADGIAALELIDGRAAALTREQLGLAAPVEGDWLLLVELAADHDQTDRLAGLLGGMRFRGEPAVGVDSAARQRLWRTREALAEVLGGYGPPLKVDVSLPLPAIGRFARDAASLVHAHVADALPVLFGHIGEGNLHLNVLRLPPDREPALYPELMGLIAECGGNVSSEHGVGSRKRRYLGMSREPTDIAVMRTIKAALDPTGYLNAAVLFE